MKKVLFVFSAIVILTAAALSLNCDGTRYRSADIDISPQQVMSNLNALVGLTGLSSDPNGTNQQLLKSFIALQQDANANAILYYAQAPSAMGQLPSQISDFDWANFSPPLTTPVSSLMVFYLISEDGTKGGLVVATNTVSSNVAAGSSPIPGASPTPAPSPSQNAGAALYVAMNDGSTPAPDGSGLMAGSFSDEDYQIELNMGGTDVVTLQTFDLDPENGLADTVQLQVYRRGADFPMAKVNVTIP